MRRKSIVLGVASLALVAFVTGCAEDKGRAQAEAQKVSAAQETGEGQAEEQSGDPAQPAANAEAGKRDSQQEPTKDKPPAERSAQRRGPDPAERWQEALKKGDDDKDGKLSKNEFEGPERAFERLDADGDGALTQREFTSAAARGRQGTTPVSGLMKMMDKNGDARISRDEWHGVFKEADANGDGFMTREEVMREMK